MWDVLRCKKTKNSQKVGTARNKNRKKLLSSGISNSGRFGGDIGTQCYGPLSLHYKCCSSFFMTSANVSLEEHIQA